MLDQLRARDSSANNKDPTALLKALSATVTVSEYGLCFYGSCLESYLSMQLLSFPIFSGVLGSPDILALYSAISPALHISIILITTHLPTPTMNTGTYTGSVSAADTITSIGSASVASSAQIHASSKRGLRGTGDSGGNVSSTSSKESRDSRDSKGRGAPPSQAPAAYMSGAALVKNGTTDGGSASPRYGQKASPRVDTSEREGRERAFDNMEDDLVYPISPSSSSGSPSSAIRNAPATGRSAGKIAWGNGADRVIGEGSTGSPGVGDFQSPPTLGRRYAADGIVDTSEPPRLSRETGENRTRGAQRNESKESGDIDRERAAKAMGDRDKRNANFTGTGTSSGPRSFTAPTVGSVSIQGASMEDGGTFASSSESAAYSSTSTGSAVGQSQRPRSGLGARLARY